MTLSAWSKDIPSALTSSIYICLALNESPTRSTVKSRHNPMLYYETLPRVTNEAKRVPSETISQALWLVNCGVAMQGVPGISGVIEAWPVQVAVCLWYAFLLGYWSRNFKLSTYKKKWTTDFFWSPLLWCLTVAYVFHKAISKVELTFPLIGFAQIRGSCCTSCHHNCWSIESSM